MKNTLLISILVLGGCSAILGPSELTFEDASVADTTPDLSIDTAADMTVDADATPDADMSIPDMMVDAPLCTDDMDCEAPNGTGACVDGVCELACTDGFDNCDGDLANGCEADTTTDTTNCGSCGTRCASCVESVCGPGIIAGDQSTFVSCVVDLNKELFCTGADIRSQLQAKFPPLVSTHGDFKKMDMTVEDVAVGQDHVCVIGVGGGSVSCWGSDSSEQLGTIASASSTSPVDVTSENLGFGAFPFSKIVAGFLFTYVLDQNGDVWAWGSNRQNQISTSTDDKIPQAVLVASNVKDVGAGNRFVCLVDMNDDVACKGQNGSGQLGAPDAVPGEATRPVGLPAMPVSKLLVLSNAACVLNAGQDVWCWGIISENGTTSPSPNAQRLSTLNQVLDIFGTKKLGCAVQANGTFCWGDRSFDRQEGNENTPSLQSWAVDGSLYFGLENVYMATPSEGIKVWGRNDLALMGADASHNHSLVAAEAQFDSTVTPENLAEVSVGGLNFQCVRSQDNNVYCAGAQQQLGRPAGMNSSSYVETVGLDDVSSLSAGHRHVCAVKSGELWCWGQIGTGILGSLPTTQALPVKHPQAPADIRAVGEGVNHMCVVHGANGAVSCIGANGSMQLGVDRIGANPAMDARNTFVPAERLDGSPLTGAVSVAGAQNTTCALLATNEIVCWGQNSSGQRGIGMPTSGAADLSKAAPVAGGIDFQSIDAGQQHFCGVSTVGSVYCWGKNNLGECGQPAANLNVPAPTEVTLAGSATSATAGWRHSCAIVGGEVFCWGFNNDGQLGNDSRVNSFVPVQVSGATGIESLSAGTLDSTRSCGVGTSGKVFCWGGDKAGSLARGRQLSFPPAEALTIPPLI